ncbi:MAG: phytanoyl-CoA dioxygenase family protein [Chitinophagaceae bacterium]
METINMETLKQSFQREGYIFIPGFLSKEEVDEVNDKMEQFIKDKVPGMATGHAMYEDKSNTATLKQMQDLNLYDPYFEAMLSNSRFKEMAEILLEEKVIGKTLEYFNKPPRIGAPTPPHQDGHYFKIKPANAVTMWMALENVDGENGCLHYVKGSHLKGLRPHGRTKTIGFSQGITDYGKEEDIETAIPAKPGDLLIHLALTIHRADGNTSNTRTRKAIGLIYYGESAQEDIEAKTAYQKILAAENYAKA